MAAKPYGNIKYEEMFIGQVPPNQILDKIDSDGWGDRVKVRIPNYHGPDTPDDKLPWAIVERPTSQGNASRGSTGLCGGEWVRGYFIDGIPVICTVLSRGTYENNISLQEAREKKSTGFKNITRYNSFSPHSGQVIGGDKPKESTQPTKQEFEKAKDIPKDQEDIITNKQKQDATLISQYVPLTPREREDKKILLRSLQRGEIGSGPSIDKAIQDIIDQLNGVRGLVRDA